MFLPTQQNGGSKQKFKLKLQKRNLSYKKKKKKKVMFSAHLAYSSTCLRIPAITMPYIHTDTLKSLVSNQSQKSLYEWSQTSPGPQYDGLAKADLLSAGGLLLQNS